MRSIIEEKCRCGVTEPSNCGFYSTTFCGNHWNGFSEGF
jgi:hypothetical protein